MPRSKEIQSKLNEFRLAWNKKDLNLVASFLDRDIVQISPELKIGIVPIKAKELEGLHHVLKFIKELWEQFDTTLDEFDIIQINQESNEIIVELLTHYPVLDITDINDLYFDSDLKITKFHHKKITKYRAIKQRPPIIRFMLKSLGKQVGNTLKKFFPLTSS